LKLRLRITLTIAIMTALAMGCALAAVYAAFSGLQQGQLDAAILEIARAEAVEAPGRGFKFSDRPGPAANDVGPLAKHGMIYDEQGGALAITSPFDRAPPARASFKSPPYVPFDFRFEVQHLRGVLVPIPGYPERVLLLAARRDDLDGDEAFLARAMLIALGFMLAWTSFVAYWVAGRLTRDHVAIAEVARRVARGDLSTRVASKAPDPELAQLGRDIDEMVERLSELMVAQRRFTAHAAHELRSPLTALYGELQQALRKERDPEGYKKAIAHALQATKRLRALADDLIVLASAQHPATGVTPVLLEDAIEEARTLASEHASARAVTVEIRSCKGVMVPARNGDVTRLFRNLIENAIRHSLDGGVVRVEATPIAACEVEIAIADDGTGVSHADRDHIFEPFYRSNGARTTEGSGLGLGIAREIARAHGGDVRLDDTPAPGARFVVVLKVAQSEVGPPNLTRT
jgi:two-component system heavy metal sensor histidine kinase CusS